MSRIRVLLACGSVCFAAIHSPAQLTVVGWGTNSLGQLESPASLTNVMAIAAGCYHSMALKSNGTVVAWGNNGNGQTNVPSGLSSVAAIAAGCYHSMVLKSNGTVVAWGSNGNGQTNVPSGSSSVVAIAAGGYHNLALQSNGTIVAWGDNSTGQTNAPAGLSGVRAISAGYYNSMVLKSNGTIVAWGDNSNGQTNVPAGLSSVAAIAAGGYHSLALKSNGTVVAWGNNASGQTNVPAGLSNVAAVAAGFSYSLALKSNGTVVAWGNNASGQTNVPAGLSNVVAISAGVLHNLALAPPFLIQPFSQSASCGSDVTFNARANGGSPTNYQWRLDGLPISGATNSAFTVSNVGCLSAGNYSVVISNAAGIFASSNALLSLPYPQFVFGCPLNIEVAGFSAVPPPDTNALVIYACGAGTLLLLSQSTNDMATCRKTITRLYAAVDSCSRTSFCTQTITVNVSPQPQIVPPFPSFISQSIQADGLHVTVCATAIFTCSYTWFTNGVLTTNSGSCTTFVFNPLEENPIVTVVLGSCCNGSTGGGGGAITTCAICLSRGTPSLLTGTDGSGTVPSLPSYNCGITNSSTTKWFKLVVTNDTGLVTLSTEGSGSSNTVLAVYTGSITSPGTLTNVACSGNTSSSNKQGRVTFNGEKGKVYWVVLDPGTNAAGLKLAAGFEPQLVNYAFKPDRSFELNSTIAPAIPYRIQAATNLATNATWSTLLTTNSTTNYQLYYRDTNASNLPRRFYRIAPGS